MNTPRTGSRTPDRTPPAQDGEGHLFTQSQAAKACGVSTSTIRTAREKGRLDFTRTEDGSIRISLAALLAAGYTPKHAGTAHPETTVTSKDTVPPSAARTTAHAAAQASEVALKDELDKLRQEAAEWRTRALVAEAQAHERKEALDSTRLALRALETATAAQGHMPTAQVAAYAPTPLIAQVPRASTPTPEPAPHHKPRSRWRSLFQRNHS